MSGYVGYSEYRDSGVEWLGSIPSNWEAVKIGHLTTVRRGASPRPIDDPIYFDERGEYCWTRIADVSASKMYLENSTQRLSDIGSSLSVKLEPGSLFLSIAGTVGKPCITAIKACIHDGFVYFPELKIPPKFLFYVFAGEQAYKGLGKFGTQLNLNTETVGGIRIGVSSPIDMQRIVDFLDHETAKIDTLIEKQQQLIKLLKEKRQAVISHAVTKGLNSDAPMKDSGVEWLGEVPAGWRLCSLGYCSSITTGATPDRTVSAYWEGDIPWIKTGEVNYADIHTTEEKITELAVNATSVRLAEPGTLLMAMYGQGVTRGRVALLGIRATFNQACAAIVPNSWLTPKYLKYYFMGCYNELRDGGNETSQMNLNAEIVGKFPVLSPPVDEQIEIVSFLEISEVRYSELLTKAHNAIALLGERRTALISAAVTGKIDVRNWQPPEFPPTPTMDA